MRIIRLVVCLAAAGAVFPAPLHAYIDPSAGSIVLQVLAAGVLTGLVTVRGWWGSVTRFFRRGRGNGGSAG